MEKIVDFLLQFKNQNLDEQEISKYQEIIKNFAQEIKQSDKLNTYEDTFLATLGFAYRLDNVGQKLYYTFSEALSALDMAKLMRDEEALKLNSTIYPVILDICIDEYIGKDADQELKQKALEAYKKLEEQKSAENKKYHMYQY